MRVITTGDCVQLYLSTQACSRVHQLRATSEQKCQRHICSVRFIFFSPFTWQFPSHTATISFKCRKVDARTPFYSGAMIYRPASPALICRCYGEQAQNPLDIGYFSFLLLFLVGHPPDNLSDLLFTSVNRVPQSSSTPASQVAFAPLFPDWQYISTINSCSRQRVEFKQVAGQKAIDLHDMFSLSAVTR